MSGPLPYDPQEELSKRYVRRFIFHCSEEELQERIDRGLQYVKRRGRVRFTRAAIEEFRRMAEETRQSMPPAPDLLMDQDAYDRQQHLNCP